MSVYLEKKQITLLYIQYYLDYKNKQKRKQMRNLPNHGRCVLVGVILDN